MKNRIIPKIEFGTLTIRYTFNDKAYEIDCRWCPKSGIIYIQDVEFITHTLAALRQAYPKFKIIAVTPKYLGTSSVHGYIVLYE